MAYIVATCVTVLCLISYTYSQEILSGPENVTVYLDQVAEFKCETIGGASSWFMDGMLLESSTEDVIEWGENTGSGSRYNHLLVPGKPKYNNTIVQCVVVKSDSPSLMSDEVLMSVQGILSAVGDLTASYSSSSVTVNWTAPFSLDVTGVDHDIWYSVIIYNVTNENNPTVMDCTDCININNTHYTFTSGPCAMYEISVVALNGAGEGMSDRTHTRVAGCEGPTTVAITTDGPTYTTAKEPEYNQEVVKYDVGQVVGIVFGAVVGAAVLACAVTAIVTVFCCRGRNKPKKKKVKSVRYSPQSAEEGGLLNISVSSSSADRKAEDDADSLQAPKMTSGITNSGVTKEDRTHDPSRSVFSEEQTSGKPPESGTAYAPILPSSHRSHLTLLSNTVCGDSSKEETVKSIMVMYHDKACQWMEIAEKLGIGHKIEEMDTDEETDEEMFELCLQTWVNMVMNASYERFDTFYKKEMIGHNGGVGQKPSTDSGGAGDSSMVVSNTTKLIVDEKEDSNDRGLNPKKTWVTRDDMGLIVTDCKTIIDFHLGDLEQEEEDDEEDMVGNDLALNCKCEEVVDNNCSSTGLKETTEEKQSTHDGSCVLLGCNQHEVTLVMKVAERPTPVLTEPPIKTKKNNQVKGSFKAIQDVKADQPAKEYHAMQCTEGTFTDGEFPEMDQTKEVKHAQHKQKQKKRKKKKKSLLRQKAVNEAPVNEVQLIGKKGAEPSNSSLPMDRCPD